MKDAIEELLCTMINFTMLYYDMKNRSTQHIRYKALFEYQWSEVACFFDSSAAKRLASRMFDIECFLDLPWFKALNVRRLQQNFQGKKTAYYPPQQKYIATGVKPSAHLPTWGPPSPSVRSRRNGNRPARRVRSGWARRPEKKVDPEELWPNYQL